MNAVALQSFGFGDQLVRTVDREGAVWFVANDVCAALEIGNSRQAVSRLADDERDCVTINDAIGRERETTVISESGVYALVFKSRKPVAVDFRRWVTSEVLPVIRRTGQYVSAANDDDDDYVAPSVPVPNMGSAEDRDNFRTAVAVIRMIHQIGGIEPARQYAIGLGFPGLTQGLSSAQSNVRAGPLVQVEGDFYKWGEAAGLKKSRIEATHLSELYDHYGRWCSGHRLKIMEAARFKGILDQIVGSEEHPEMFRCIMSAVRGY